MIVNFQTVFQVVSGRILCVSTLYSIFSIYLGVKEGVVIIMYMVYTKVLRLTEESFKQGK